MHDRPTREPEHIRRSCVEKLRSVECSPLFQAILACLLGEDWTTPRLVEILITPDNCMIGQREGQTGHDTFLGASADLIRNIHGIAAVAELDGDEIGYLLGRVAEVKRR